MSFKSIVTMLDNNDECATRTGFAVNFAQHYGAHLIGVAPQGYAAALVVDDLMGSDSSWIADLQQRIDDDVEAATIRFDQQCSDLQLATYESRVVRGFAAQAMSAQVPFSDLVILGQSNDNTDPVLRNEGLNEHLLLTCSRPLLLLPSVGQHISSPSSILVGWTQSRESALAIREALPLLQQADDVEIVSIEKPKKLNKHSKTDDHYLLEYLKRHHVEASIRHLPYRIDAANALLSHACDSGAQLLVVGGYGHARLREWALGGVTRTLLQSMTIPVLMAH